MNDTEPRFILAAPDRLAASLVDLWADAMEQMEEPSDVIEQARAVAVRLRAENLEHRRMSLNVLDLVHEQELETALLRRGRIVIARDWASDYASIGQAEKIERDKYGHWFHPGFPWSFIAADASFEPLLEALNLEATAVYMVHDNPELHEHRYSEQDDQDCSYWEPSKPAGVEWFLLCITDTEDGPAATFARKASKGLNPGAAWPFPPQPEPTR